MNHFEFTDPADTLPRHMAAVGLDLHSDRVRLFADLWSAMQDLPRHLGQHSGGMVICQGQLDAVVPLENATMPGRVVVQWDKDDCADMGIVKVDLLGLGMLSAIQDTLALVNGDHSLVRVELDIFHGAGVPPQAQMAQGCHALAADTREHSGASASGLGVGAQAGNKSLRVDLAHLPPDDPAVYKMLQEADTIS